MDAAWGPLGLVWWLGWGCGGAGLDDISVDQVQTEAKYNLKKLFDSSDNDDLSQDDDPYSKIGHSCSYFDPDEFQSKYAELKNSFSSFSHNIRSLAGSWGDF